MGWLEHRVQPVRSVRVASKPEGRSESERLHEAAKRYSHTKLICGVNENAKGLPSVRWPVSMRKN